MARPPEHEALLDRWRTEEDDGERDRILGELVTNKIFPGAEQEEYERTGGLYPDLEDPEFIVKLIRKREFQESKQKTIKESMDEGIDK
jgi:hypothetical protein